MLPDIAAQQLKEAMGLVMYLSMPPIIAASVVGILISLLQALTQLQEQTVAFAVKLVAVSITLAIMAGMLGSEIVNFAMKLFNEFPRMI
ncbi:EscS/YscS/HrcS family type III secretion system export apparatus protein [Nitratireductor aestuarii]|uniref:EscS/YscS/HrcS family type III secretion system export apparatus protein n=1 Tax=Nitratireductor aestuarii TaxID=1735103 RepID=A0A916W4H4_9HYPH|nr:type III secretion system export apparatus subunit SctS [Nitratireductor aestuarii]GGA64874.1 EscS/YscS/HrcS family type III secretion system export apparatus protein [Nitratireductor aestuarii]